MPLPARPGAGARRPARGAPGRKGARRGCAVFIEEEEKRDPEDHSPPQSPTPEPTPETPATPAGSGSGGDSIPIRKEARNARTLPPVNRDVRLDPARIDAARLVHKRMMDRCGFRFVPIDGGLNIRIEAIPGIPREGFPDAPDPDLLAAARTLKAEILASLAGGRAGFVPRDEAVKVESILASLCDPPKFAELLMVRYRDDRPDVRAELEDAAALMDPDRLAYLVGKAEDAGDPIRWFRKSVCQALAVIRRQKAPGGGTCRQTSPAARLAEASAP